jgi:hypothetical protein
MSGDGAADPRDGDGPPDAGGATDGGTDRTTEADGNADGTGAPETDGATDGPMDADGAAEGIAVTDGPTETATVGAGLGLVVAWSHAPRDVPRASAIRSSGKRVGSVGIVGSASSGSGGPIRRQSGQGAVDSRTAARSDGSNETWSK